MRKGDKLRLITVGPNKAPAETLEVVVQDVKGNMVTCLAGPILKGLGGTAFIDGDAGDPYYVRRYVAGPEAILQIEYDDITAALFSPAQLEPRFNRKNLRYEYGMPQGVLDAWVGVGILLRERIDWHYACRECDTMVTVREGCYNCYHPGDKKARLLRHNKCGYIGYGHQFDNWTCPGCKEAVPNEQQAFETILGPAKCVKCGYKERPTLVASCLGCWKSFPLAEAVEMPLFTYRKKPPTLTRTSGATV